MKRRCLSILLVLCMVMALLPTTAWAADSDFTIDENGVLTKYNGSGGDVVIPDGVTSIGYGAFDGCTSLTSITLPDSVTSIGTRAFAECSNLSSINIPNGVISIGYWSFFNCSNLTNINIPNSVTSIEEGAFIDCSGLTSITIPDGVGSINDKVFTGCTGLTSIAIPNSVTSIGNQAFRNCSGLASITIPNNVTSIGAFAFQDCSNLTSFTAPDSVTSVGEYAFSGCGSLTSVTILNSRAFIGEYAFYNCNTLTSLAIPDSVTSTGRGPFYGCTSLTSITIPNGITSVGQNAFSNCDKLTSITIPDGVTSIEWGAFSHCSALTSVTIPDGVTSIGRFAFQDCSKLARIIIPNSVTSIGDNAFQGCGALSSITIPDGVTSIGFHTFYDCSSLTNITIPNSITSIGDWAFYNCSGLTSITIPDSVTSIGTNAFENCSGLTSFSIPNGITSIARFVFQNCSGLTSITIPGNVTSIDRQAFTGCSSLSGIAIPDSVTSIGDDAFKNCSALTRIIIPHSVASIGYHPFSGCSGLTTAGPIGGGYSYEFGWTSEIPNNAFSGCSGLTNITIPGSVTSIGEYTFSNCNKLTDAGPTGGGYSYEFGWTTEIPNNAFSGCSGLTRVTIPASVTDIGQNAFSGCGGLSDIYYASSRESWALIGGEGKPSGETVTIHYNSTGPDDIGSDNMNSVYFLSGWDAATRKVQFGDEEITPDTYTVADSVDVSNINSLLNKYVLVTMEQGDSSLEYTITDIQPVESRIGTVSATVEHSLTIDGTTYPVREDYVLASYDGEEVLYHTYNGTIMGFDVLEEKTGTLEAWDSTAGKVTIDSKAYSTNYMSDLSYLKNLDISSHPKVEYVVPVVTNGLDYQPVLRLMVSSYETKIGIFTQYDSATNTAYIDGQGYPVDTSSCNLGSNNFNGKQVFSLLKNGKIIHMDATGNVKSALRVTLSPQKVNVTYKDNKLSANEFDVGVTVSHSCSYAFPDHYDRSIIYAAAGLQPTKLDTVAWEGDKLSFSNSNLAGVTLAVGENQSGTVKVAIDKKYVLVSDSETLVATCTVTGIPGSNGQTLNAQQTVSIQIKREGTQTEDPNVPVETPESATWKNTLLKAFYKAEDISAASTPGSLFLRRYFDKDVVDDIGKALAVWLTAMESPLAEETSGVLPPYLKITYTMNNKNSNHRASIWFRKMDGFDVGYASASGVSFTLVDNDSKRIITQDSTYSLKLSASSRTFADGMEQYLKKEFGKDWIDFNKKLMKDTFLDSVKEMSHVSGKEYINTILDLLKDYKSIVEAAKKVTNYAGQAQDVLTNPLEVVAASTKDFDDACKRVYVKCPVDVYVYNVTGALCGSIVNNEIDTDTFEVFMDVSGSEKAVWLHDDYTIKLVATGEGSMEYSITEYSEETKTRTVLFNAVPLNFGLTYDGNIPKELDVDASDYALTSDTGDIIYADNIITYENVFRIFFDANGGTVQNPTMPTETTGKLLNLPIPIHTGYTFDGWFTSASGGNKITTDYVFTSDTTVYAHWTKNSGGSSGSGTSSGGGSSSGGSSSTSYSITAGNSAHGSVSVSPKSASKGTKVTLTIQPDSGYTLESLVVKDNKGNAVELTKESNAKYTFTMPNSKVTIDAAFIEIERQPSGQISFTDVSSNAYYYDAVAWAVEQGITSGTTATTFSPDAPCTRAQIVTFLWRAAGSPSMGGSNPFTDVTPGSYYYDAVQWAVAQGITVGTSATTFSPDATCTRGQTVTFLYRYEKSPAVSGGNAFTDVPSNAYYTNAVQWAVNNGVTSGTSATTFSPNTTCTRGQIVTFLYRDMA